MDGLPSYLILFAVGGVAGALNVLAGGGSLITLPVMIFLGLPPSVANGTNRVAILAQNIGAVYSFHRHHVIDWRWLRLAAVPAVLGALAGAWAAVEIGDDAFRRALAIIIVVVTLWTLWDPLRSRPVGEELGGTETHFGRIGLVLAFFFIGVYGGFVQAGVGFLILAVVTAGGLNLVRGNALKVLVVLSFTPLALAYFALNDRVAWGMGIALAAGNLVGGLLGVRLTVLKGHAWIRRVVTVTVIAFAVRLWWG